MPVHLAARAALLLLAAAAFAAGCGGPASPQAQPTPTGTTAGASIPPATGSPAVAVAVPDSLKFSAVTIDGKAFDAASLSGRPVVLWFWAAWCPRCRAKAGDVAAVQRDLGSKVHVVGVAGLGSGDAMGKFAADTGITGFPNLADDKGEVWKKFGVTTQEYFVILDKTGTVVHSGALSGADLRQRAAALAG